MSAVQDVRQRVDLEALVVWAVKAQRADCDDVSLHDVEAAAEGLEPAAWSTDGVSSLMRRGALGCRVDGGSAVRGVAPRIHPDAEAVMVGVNTIGDRRRRSLILHYARAGFRPDWLPWQQRLVAVPVDDSQAGRHRHRIEGEWENLPERSEIARRMLGTGRPLVDRRGRSVIDAAERGYLFRHNDAGQRQVFARWCALVEEPSLLEIREVNDVYAQWHAGMMTLLGKLLVVPLKERRLTGFKAPAQPWA
ncbi:hypothetical protein D3869_01480 [Azospirillum brasilense]|uniref:Uncharacterized protein n=1 Tax=Azospirillum brasilense TaxID=192 RepID=A0A4D8QV09_AZOBR|nr:hypothetical protein [Azospirillum brasilense]QCO14007.1 hypothetical protein D3869_01480 [Azospirillum brasilense]